MIPRRLGWLLGAGFLAHLLAAPDPDVESGIEAYESGDHEAAIERFEQALERHPNAPEILYDLGLVHLARGEVEAARSAFETGTESTDEQVRASSHYELGNLALDAEDWPGAIEAFKACLRDRPDHAGAKWNLELALLRKQEQEQEEQEQQDQQEENGDGDGDGDGDGEGDEQEQSGDGDGDGDGDQEQEQDGDGDQEQEPEGGDGDADADQEQEPKGGDGDGDQEGEQEPQPQGGDGDGDQEGEQEQPPPEGGDADEDAEQEPQEAENSQGGQEGEQGEQSGRNQPGDGQAVEGKEIDQADLDRALEQLDQQDQFLLGRPGRGRGGPRKPKQDW